MTVFRTTSDAAEFLKHARDYLRSRPVEHSVMLTNAERRFADAEGDDLWCWLSTADGEVAATAMHTPPFGLYLSVGPDDAVRTVAGELHERGRELPSVGGPLRQAETFAEAWAGLVGVTGRVRARQGIYAADAVTPPTGVPGRIRRAESTDLPLLRTWHAGFFTDTGHPVEADDTAERVADGRLYVWDVDGTVVSMAGITAPAAGVARVVLVYTPRELRGHGYASACVAALTARQLAEPGRTCMLYTDLANPTSNGIYQAIGYRRIGDAVHIVFD
ncbi:MAG TPA: GNAT family N-acetyltransferase [Nocardioidaceae bacterium]|nr:GNAT family N-acetyltransferase [Nocardioidaceae bacterium]